ncbi:MAG: hypothetical protein A2Y14_03060 [Verrucomicrobia bacterium GWF2_51_19]|nr:MAG: hypothetical protein A2Y14_03060 [Verrucomicrobia bacterium GWF2_51_19]HCJ11568.1 hypothetical protein [Opitutae bacterium]
MDANENELNDVLLNEIALEAKQANEQFSVSLNALVHQHQAFLKNILPLLNQADPPSEALKEELRQFLKTLSTSSNKVTEEWEAVKDVLDTVSLLEKG